MNNDMNIIRVYQEPEGWRAGPQLLLEKTGTGWYSFCIDPWPPLLQPELDVSTIRLSVPHWLPSHRYVALN